MEMNGQLHAPAVLLPEKSPRLQQDDKLGWLQSRSGRTENRNVSCYSQKSNPDSAHYVY
jgi:hypothetical protein